MEVSGQFRALKALLSGKEHRYPLKRKLAGPKSRYGFSEEENVSQDVHPVA
jgi:hypothetical protein